MYEQYIFISAHYVVVSHSATLMITLENGKLMCGHYINESSGWEIGTGPTVVVVNEGVAKNLTTSTLKDDAYAFIFDQQGLMASISIEGTKISKIKHP